MILSMVKFEILKEGGITVMFSAQKDQIQQVVDAYKASQAGERFRVEREQMQLPIAGADKVSALSEILSEIKALHRRIEQEFMVESLHEAANTASSQAEGIEETLLQDAGAI